MLLCPPSSAASRSPLLAPSAMVPSTATPSSGREAAVCVMAGAAMGAGWEDVNRETVVQLPCPASQQRRGKLE